MQAANKELIERIQHFENDLTNESDEEIDSIEGKQSSKDYKKKNALEFKCCKYDLYGKTEVQKKHVNTKHENEYVEAMSLQS